MSMAARVDVAAQGRAFTRSRTMARRLCRRLVAVQLTDHAHHGNDRDREQQDEREAATSHNISVYIPVMTAKRGCERVLTTTVRTKR